MVLWGRECYSVGCTNEILIGNYILIPSITVFIYHVDYVPCAAQRLDSCHGVLSSEIVEAVRGGSLDYAREWRSPS